MKKPASNQFMRTTVGIILSIVVMICLSISGYAQPTQPAGEAAYDSSYEVMLDNLQVSLKTEENSVDKLRIRADKLKQDDELFFSVLSSYQIQLTSHKNLLLLNQTTLSDLLNAASMQERSLDSIMKMIEEATENYDLVKTLQSQTESQIKLFQEKESNASKYSFKKTDSENVSTLINRLSKTIAVKQIILSEMAAILTKKVDALNTIKDEFEQQSNALSENIREKRTEKRFERKEYPFGFQVLTVLRAELESIRSKITQLPKRDLLIAQLKLLWQSSGVLFLTAALLYALFVAVVIKLMHIFSNLRAGPLFLEFPWRSLAIRLFNRSLLLSGTIVFIFAYTKLRDIYDSTPFFYYMIHILLIFLYTNWGLGLIKIWFKESPKRIPASILYRLRFLILAVRYFAIIYLASDWLLQNDSVTIMLLRLTFEMFIIFWIISLKKHWEKNFKDKYLIEGDILAPLQRLFFPILYIIIAIPVVLELIGYGPFSAYWMASLGHSFVVLFWAGIFFFILREWDQKFYTHNKNVSNKPAQPIKWFIFRLCWLVWALCAILFLVFAWGGQQAIISGLGKFLSAPVKFGNFQLSLLELMHAFLFLFFTHIVVRLWRFVIQDKFLDKSGLDPGIKNSIISINVYILWSLGILAALSAFGVSGTSLTVAFGALSIGLGFGMQNIFNNFISGIILLFERPIQVGDAVEINGTWAEVKKINFRSTVVQTYDNASLIIPNSEFISSQVTNWSFRDLTLRIKVSVGVAYGSDIERVRSTLLEIAGKTEKVLAYPRPDVLFSDFGDSALIFVLRLWTDVDSMLKVGTAIRFEIDRLFRERNIEIAFPQRDIHIRSSVTAQPANESTVAGQPPEKKEAP